MRPEGPIHAPLENKGRRWKWVFIPLLVVLAGFAIYQGWGATQKKAAKPRGFRPEIAVRVTPVIRKPLVHLFSANADILPLMQVDLFPRVSGYLERIDVALGDSVRQGQVIAQIDRTEFFQKVKEVEAKAVQARAHLLEIETGPRTEELRQAEEGVKQARARFENAKFHRERIENLYKRDVISKKEMDIAEMEFTVAQAQLASSQESLKLLQEGARQEVKEASRAKLREAEAILEQERIRLGHTQIVAPFSGEVSRRYVDAGALVSPSTPLVNITHTETVKVVANVIEKDISFLKPGMKAKIETESYRGKAFEGKIARISGTLDLATRTLQVEIEIPNPKRLLKPGMFARLEVALLEKPEALVIPRNAVIEERGVKSVFVVEGNQALRKIIATGFEQGPFAEVLQGLSEGDPVVVQGQESLKDRSTIRVIEGG